VELSSINVKSSATSEASYLILTVVGRFPATFSDLLFLTVSQYKYLPRVEGLNFYCVRTSITLKMKLEPRNQKEN
jgi:hypothetical protein